VPKRLAYTDHCAVAFSLDVVGDRWTLLVVRDLVLGPRSFTQLRSNLTGIAPDVLTARLRHLTETGLIEALNPLYALTARGRGLVPVLQALAVWGDDLLPTSPSAGTLSAHSLLTAVVLVGSVDPSVEMTLRLNVDDETAVLCARDGMFTTAAPHVECEMVLTLTTTEFYELVSARRPRRRASPPQRPRPTTLLRGALHPAAH
jgi:DNA-binding HxlR family transcriptional regulator